MIEAIELRKLAGGEHPQDNVGRLFEHKRTICRQKPDLMIIDGPPNCLGGREGVLYQAMQWARAGTLVLLDDANRREEQSAISCWKDTLGEAITVEYLSGFAKGLSAIVIHEPIPIASLWSRRLERSRAELVGSFQRRCRLSLSTTTVSVRSS